MKKLIKKIYKDAVFLSTEEQSNINDAIDMAIYQLESDIERTDYNVETNQYNSFDMNRVNERQEERKKLVEKLKKIRPKLKNFIHLAIENEKKQENKKNK